MSQVSTIGVDIAKHVFHVHGADERGVAVFGRRLSRSKVLKFFVSSRWKRAAGRITGRGS